MSDIRRLITVDGRAGVGKTTLGQRLARELGLPLIDTGLFYRGLMVAAVRAGLALDQTERLIALAHHTRLRIDTDPDAAPELAVIVDGVAAGSLVRDPTYSRLLSTISRLPPVRAALLVPQRDAARSGGVAVGRDCGTVVFPKAPVKIYLIASEDVRVGRRLDQLGTRSEAATADVRTRDRLDAAALDRAPTAHVIDTGDRTPDETFEAALEICRAAGIS